MYVDVVIGEYADYFSTWWGLEDGTMLEASNDQGRTWVKVGNKTMTVEEWNEL